MRPRQQRARIEQARRARYPSISGPRFMLSLVAGPRVVAPARAYRVAELPLWSWWAFSQPRIPGGRSLYLRHRMPHGRTVAVGKMLRSGALTQQNPGYDGLWANTTFESMGVHPTLARLLICRIPAACCLDTICLIMVVVRKRGFLLLGVLHGSSRYSTANPGSCLSSKPPLHAALRGPTSGPRVQFRRLRSKSGRGTEKARNCCSFVMPQVLVGSKMFEWSEHGGNVLSARRLNILEIEG